MISISELSKSYGDRMLFGGMSMQLNAGERYGLVGANGSGKTTLLRLITGALDPDSGGLVVHHVKAPRDWDHAAYNSWDSEARIEDLLVDS